MTRETYKGYIIEEGDWKGEYYFCSEEYDGPGDHRHGTGKTIEDCKEQIDTMIDDEPRTLDEADVRYDRANEKYFEETGSQL